MGNSSQTFFGTVTLGTTAVQMPVQPASDSMVAFQSKNTNTGMILIGRSATTCIFELKIGQEYQLPASGLELFWAKADTAGQVLNWAVGQ